MKLKKIISIIGVCVLALGMGYFGSMGSNYINIDHNNKIEQLCDIYYNENGTGIENTFIQDCSTENPKLVYQLNEQIGSDGSGDKVRKMLRYASNMGFDHVIIELDTPGGNLYESMRIANSLIEWSNSKEGRIVETRVCGHSMSGGFLIMVAGTEGYRVASKHCFILWHNPYIPKHIMRQIEIQRPDLLEKFLKGNEFNAKMMIEYIMDRSNITKEELIEKIGTVDDSKDWLMSGKEAKKYGFIDRFLDEN